MKFVFQCIFSKIKIRACYHSVHEMGFTSSFQILQEAFFTAPVAAFRGQWSVYHFPKFVAQNEQKHLMHLICFVISQLRKGKCD